MPEPKPGTLAGALAKAQVAFAPVKRDKKVTVKLKTGGSYEFSYAPLDSILEAVRKPLADNGLVVVQLLDAGDLVTMLLHESGERLSGSVALPSTTDIQGLGSAITYLRRYAIQALLGIAAEDDDDGNRASGNQATPMPTAVNRTSDDGSLIGTAEVGKVGSGADFELRQSPEGPVLAFRLTQGRKGWKVIAHGALAVSLATIKPVGQLVSVWGSMQDETMPIAGGRTATYQVVNLERIKGADFELPAQEAATVPLGIFPDADEAAAIVAQEMAEAAS